MSATSAPSRAAGIASGTRTLGERRPWRCLMLLEIANFAQLRRHVGRTAAESMVHEIVAKLQTSKRTDRAVAVGRDLIELRVDGLTRRDLEALVADCEALFGDCATPAQMPVLVELVVGAAVDRGSAADDVRLIEEAELALAEARREHRLVVRDTSHAAVPLDGIALARDLPDAITGDELFLQYQPKLHVRKQSVTSVEALIRWRHPRRGLVLPNDFIPLAEQSRVIVDLTLWTIRRVIADQKTLRAADHAVAIFINISGMLLTDTAFVRQACALIQESGAAIGFEITETSVIRDPQSAIANLNVFSDIGVTIAIDDYGAGLSSLAYLKQLPAKELKIDKMFVTQLTSSHRDPLIVRSTIDLAHALEMEVVAEGVETPAALALLSVMGCDMVQGFLISRPIGLDALVAFLGNQDNHLLNKPETRLGRFAVERRAQ